MTKDPHEPSTPWEHAVLAAALFAVDPRATGGICLRGRFGPARQRWLEILMSLMPDATPVRRMPHSIGDERLFGGLDIGASLAMGKPVAARGLLAEADGGIIVLSGGEHIEARAAAALSSALDRQGVQTEREGVSAFSASRFGLVVLDEGSEADEMAPASLRDRLAFAITTEGVELRSAEGAVADAADVAKARGLLPRITIAEDAVEAVCAAADAFGVDSVRAPLLALNVARASAALRDSLEVDEHDLALAVAYVLASRATRLPTQQQQEQPPPPEQQPPENEPEPEDSEPPPDTEQMGDLAHLTIEAAMAMLPDGLLAALTANANAAQRLKASGRVGTEIRAARRGRPAGVRKGRPHAGVPLDLSASLRSAAPWQRLRRREAGLPEKSGGAVRPLWRMQDLHIRRFRHQSATAILFVVDASGSSAINRLAEAKGAVELLLSDCYARRDHVALVTFGGQGAETLLPLTRSLVRAKRSLAALPGGGGTPLATAIDKALELGLSARRKGMLPSTVFLTDGRANIARDGSPGRAGAMADALAAARLHRAAGLSAMVIDISPRPQQQAEKLAGELGATYLPLPHADAHELSRSVRAAAPKG